MITNYEGGITFSKINYFLCKKAQLHTYIGEIGDGVVLIQGWVSIMTPQNLKHL